MHVIDEISHRILIKSLTKIVSETNGVSLADTLELLAHSELRTEHPTAYKVIESFQQLLNEFAINKVKIQELLQHPLSAAFWEFFRNFPIRYNEEHIHLTGALTAEFLYPRLRVLLDGPNRDLYQKKITEVYGPSAWPIQSVADVDRLIRLKENEGFSTYLKILYLPKLIFVDREAHSAAAYHLASELYHKYNVGHVRLKFTLSRASSSSSDQVPGAEKVTPEDVVLGLYDGFRQFQQQHHDFGFVLSPSFRKEAGFFDSDRFRNRREHFEAQVDEIVRMLDTYPFLEKHMTDVDTVGSESEHYRKEHFNEFQKGFRKLQYRGLKVRSHHGETFYTLKKGIQAVDNAMNIWHIDTLEHGLSLGINPNFYFHRLYQMVLEKNRAGIPITAAESEYRELLEMDWGVYKPILNLLLEGKKLTPDQQVQFVKAKFHTAREVEHYQHDVLNRIIQKSVTLIALPSSNNKLTGQFEDYKDHPFSWWEKKGIQLGVGTDNYITLNTNYLQELLILLYTDPENLKITKLLMVASGENRRPFISHLLWKMRKRPLFSDP